jgi:hypothetical protein
VTEDGHVADPGRLPADLGHAVRLLVIRAAHEPHGDG